LFVSGSYDFIAFNYYDSFRVRPMTEDEFKAEKYLLNKDSGVHLVSNADKMDDVILLPIQIFGYVQFIVLKLYILISRPSKDLLRWLIGLWRT